MTKDPASQTPLPEGNPHDQQFTREAELPDVINALKNMVHHLNAIAAVINPAITVLHNLHLKIQQDEMANKLEL